MQGSINGSTCFACLSVREYGSRVTGPSPSQRRERSAQTKRNENRGGVMGRVSIVTSFHIVSLAVARTNLAAKKKQRPRRQSSVCPPVLRRKMTCSIARGHSCALAAR